MFQTSQCLSDFTSELVDGCLVTCSLVSECASADSAWIFPLECCGMGPFLGTSVLLIKGTSGEDETHA